MNPKKQVYVGSNSLPVGVTETNPGEFSISRKSGGLAIGVEAAFKADGAYEKAHWMGIAAAPKDNQEGLNEKLNQDYDSSYLFVTPQEQKEFYGQSANGVFWPLTHGMPEKVGSEASYKIHEDISERYANKLHEKIQSDLQANGGKIEDTQVWLHDYHVASVPKYLKENNPALNVSFFHHETWPEHKPELETLKYADRPLGERSNPIRKGQGSSYSPEGSMKRQDEIRFRTMLKNLLHADSIGFHTETDKENFIKTVENFELASDPEKLEEVKGKLFVAPIGIPKEKVEREFNNSLAELKNPSDSLLENVEKWKSDVIPKAQTEENRTQLNDAADRLTQGKGTLHDLQSLELSLAAYERVVKGKQTLFDTKTLESGQLFDSKKTHIGSVQRFDYTKGVHEQLDAFQAVLQDRKANGNAHPEKELQLNLVCSSARDIPAYAKYEKEAMVKIREINTEFPGAVNYIPGIPNEKLPAFNATNDLSSATSSMNGFILSIGEAALAQDLALKKGAIPERETCGTIISNKAGISESLGGEERTSKNEALAIVEPTTQEIKEKGFEQQIDRIEQAKAGRAVKGDFGEIPNLIPDTKDFGTKALDFASAGNRRGLDTLRRTTVQRSRASLNRKRKSAKVQKGATKQVKL